MNQKKEGKKMSSKEMQEMLIENFVGLQRAMTNLSVKFESLSDQIARLLQIFEISAKNFVKSSAATGDAGAKDMLDKIDSLLEQNKTIAKGLVIMEEKLRGNQDNVPQMPPIQPPMQDRPRPKPLPRI